MFRWAYVGVVLVLGVSVMSLVTESRDARTGQGPSDPPVPSAIALLGETWDMPPAQTNPEEESDSVTIQSSALRPVPRPLADDRALANVVLASKPLRPIARPTQTLANGSFSQPRDTPAETVTEVGAPIPTLPVRWVVRRQGSGEVVAHLPLREALALVNRSRQ